MALGAILSTTFKIAMIPIVGLWNTLKGIWNLTWYVIDGISNLIGKITGIEGGFTGLYNKVRPFLMWIYDFVKQIGNIMFDVFTFNFKGVKEKISAFKMPDMAEIRQRIKVETETSGDFAGVPGTDPNGGKLTPNPLATDLQSTAAGSQTKSITINIDSFIKGFSPTHQSVNGMSKDELERWVTEMFLRVVRSAETTM